MNPSTHPNNNNNNPVGPVAPKQPAGTTLKNLTDDKLISFAIGTQKKSRFQKQREEAEAKKKQDEAEAAKVYESFVDSFKDEDEDGMKPFVKAGQSRPATTVKVTLCFLGSCFNCLNFSF
jgi:hypothetical protein